MEIKKQKEKNPRVMILIIHAAGDVWFVKHVANLMLTNRSFISQIDNQQNIPKINKKSK